MATTNTLKVKDIVIIERVDLGGQRIPFHYRHYINEKTYIDSNRTGNDSM